MSSSERKTILKINPTPDNRARTNSVGTAESAEAALFTPSRNLSRSPPLTPVPRLSASTSTPKTGEHSSTIKTRSQSRKLQQGLEEAGKEPVLETAETSAIGLADSPINDCESEPGSDKGSQTVIEKQTEKFQQITLEDPSNLFKKRVCWETTPGLEEDKKFHPENDLPETNMDTTIADARGTAKPAVPTFISPPIFHPSRGLASTFIANYERTALANGWDNGLKITYFPSFLDGGASLWYKLYSSDGRNAQNTWGRIIEDFLEEFDDPDILRSRLRKLEQRKQGENETVKDYYYELKTLFYEVNQGLEFDAFVKYFEDGLTEESSYHYYWLTHPPNSRPTTFEDVKELAVTIDKAPRKPNHGSLSQNEARGGEAVNINNRPAKHFYNNRPQNYPTYVPQEGSFENKGPGYNYINYSNQRKSPQSWNRFRDRNTGFNGGNLNRTQSYNVAGNNYRSTTDRPLPETRTNNNRVRCYNCNRIGHFASSCQKNGNTGRRQ